MARSALPRRLLPLLLISATSLFAQEAADKAKAKPKAAPNPAMAKIVDDPKLPRVLLIGDSISIGYTLPVRELLKGEANVHRIPVNGGPTSNGIRNIDAWLGDEKWAVIHFNWGLHDLKLIEGQHQVVPADYEANLRKLVARMKQTGAILVWCSTTPVPECELNPPGKLYDVIDYNTLAAKVMADEKVLTNDLFGFVKPQQAEIQNLNDVHFSEKGSQVLAEKVAKEILGALIVRKKEGERGRQGDGEQTSAREASPSNMAASSVSGTALAGGESSTKPKKPAASALPLTQKADAAESTSVSTGLERLKHNNPGLVVDLGVGLWAWPVPCDADGDGDFDLIVSCPDKPYNGTYLFENPTLSNLRDVSPPVLGAAAHQPVNKFPVFKPARRLSAGHFNVTPSYVDGRLVVTTPGNVHPDFLNVGLDKPQKLSLLADPIGKNPDWFKPHKSGVYKLRHNQWRFVDYDGDKSLDLVIALENWSEYGWDDAWDANGHWKNGPLHGLLYLFKNTGSTEQPKYAEPKLLTCQRAVSSPVPSPPPSGERARVRGPSGEETLTKQKTKAEETPHPNPLPSKARGEGTGEESISTFGLASPNFTDFDGDGDLDLLCGEFLDGFTYFQNVGSRTEPRYAAGKRLLREGHPLTMDLEMIVPVAFDWDADGDLDLIVGDEDGRVALVENYGPCVEGVPQFLAPKYFQQEAEDVKFGALATTCGFDWDGDGDTDLIAGNTAGYVAFIENLSGPGVERPRWAAPDKLEAAGETIRIMAGPNGSIQGPAEAKWGYTTQTVADWDHDGLPDLIVNSIWGKVHWYRNVGTRTEPELAAAQPIEVAWPGKTPKPEWTWWEPTGKELVTQWRTTPVAVDFNQDGLCDLVMLDHEGYLAFFERRYVDAFLIPSPPSSGERARVRGPRSDDAPQSQTAKARTPHPNPLPTTEAAVPEARGEGTGQKAEAEPSTLNSRPSTFLLPGQRKFVDEQGQPLQLNAKRAGGSGRRKLCVVDWDGDGKLDVLLNGVNANLLRQVETRDGAWVMQDMGPLDPRQIEGHDTSPTTVDWNNDGVPDLLVGAEDGRFYYLKNSRAAKSGLALQAGLRTEAVAQVDGAAPEGSPAFGKAGLLTTEFLYSAEAAPTVSCHASTIVESKDGLVAAWFGGTYEKHPDVGIWFSRHIDGKWSVPVEVANGVESPEKRYPCWNPILFQPALAAGGKKPEQPLPLMLFYKVGPSPDTWWGMLITSDDGGRTWSKPRRLPDGILGPIKNKPIQLPNGDILSGTSSEHAGWRVHFERSTDLGQTWTASAPINDGKQIGAIQPSFLVHKDGRLQAVGRTQQKHVFEVSSTDGGLTWGPLTLTSLPNPNAGTDAVTLADGRHLIVYNHTPRGRSPLNVAVSTDGQDWQAALVLERDPGEYSYPAVIETNDGLVHITYTWKRKLVKHVVVDPKHFTSKPILEGKWPE